MSLVDDILSVQDWYYLTHEKTRKAIMFALFGGATTAIIAMNVGGYLSLAVILSGLLAVFHAGVWLAPSGRTVAIQWDEYEKMFDSGCEQE